MIVAGSIDGVVESRTAAVLQTVHRCGQQRSVVGEILHHLTMPVEAHNEGFVKIWADGVLQKSGGSILFEVEPTAHRAAGIDQKSKLDRQVSFAAEIHNG